MCEVLELVEVGASLASARRRAKLSQSSAAEASNTTQATISRYEKGQLNVSISQLISLAKAYNVTLSQLLKRTTTNE